MLSDHRKREWAPKKKLWAHTQARLTLSSARIELATSRVSGECDNQLHQEDMFLSEHVEHDTASSGINARVG